MSKRNSKASYGAMIKTLRLNQTAAARFLNFNERTSRRYCKGEWPPPKPVALLFAVMIAKRVTPERAEQMLQRLRG